MGTACREHLEVVEELWVVALEKHIVNVLHPEIQEGLLVLGLALQP